MKSPLTVIVHQWPFRLLGVLVFLASPFHLSSRLAAQTGSDLHGVINQTLTQSSGVQDSIRREIARISYLMTTKNINPNFYLDPNWQSSFIITPDDNIYYFSGRMNAVDNSIEVKLDEEIRTIHPDQLKVAVTGTRTFLPVKGSDIDYTDQRIVYLEVLSYGKIHLLVHHFYRMQTGGNTRLSPNTNGGNFKILPIYYYIDHSGVINRLRASRKNTLEIFGDRSEELESYARENRLRFSDENDLVALFDYYNRGDN